ncbi:hypothetical protein DH2020_032216 [Rehmannia glutinosa]|uniref:Endonuclease/exonuclease/phosphatase domain-containing protein n=1 Tax=Rehmannia glutinosa TaxID=99300 RepID=A0ABR0VJ47_REHGL
MAEDLTSLYSNLTLNDEENTSIPLNSDDLNDFDGTLCLVGKVLSPEPSTLNPLHPCSKGSGLPVTAYRANPSATTQSYFNFETELTSKNNRGCKSSVIDKIKQSLNFYGFSVDARGRSGGLALLWHKDTHVSLHNFSDRYIDVEVELSGQTFRWTGIYGEPNVQLQGKAGATLKSSFQPELPWLICGDFNEVLTQSEFQGSHPRANWQMNLFRDTLTYLNMFDLGIEGPQFTWNRLLVAPHTQRARLDRAICNSLWHDLFPWTRSRNPNLFRQNKRRVFRFETCWVKQKEFEEVIKQQWDDSLSNLPAKLEKCSLGLINWSKHNQRDTNSDIETIKKRILSLKNGAISEEAKAELQQLQIKLDLLLDQLDIKWKQRAKQHWYKEGDRNTQFFHAYASKRKSNNHIAQLKDPSGTLRDSPRTLSGLSRIILALSLPPPPAGENDISRQRCRTRF